MLYIGVDLGTSACKFLLVDENGEVLRRAILWNDGRTADEVDYLNGTVGKETLSSRTANIAFAGFTAPKLLWMRKHEPELFVRIAKIMLPKDYLVYKLTGVHATDCSDASGMLLLDVKNRCWSAEMLAECGLSQHQLPRLFESWQPVGTLLPSIAAQLGLPENVTVCAGAGDNAAAAVGTGTVGDGRCNISLGTSGTIFISSSKFGVDPNNALHAFAHADGGWHLMGCMLSAASCNSWWQNSISSRFTKKCGYTFIAYLNQLRLERARELLLQTDWRMYEISEHVGYNSVEHFNHTFKKKFGISPSDYRNGQKTPN